MYRSSLHALLTSSDSIIISHSEKKSNQGKIDTSAGVFFHDHHLIIHIKPD